MRESATELKSAADSMNVFSSHIRDVGNKLAGAVTEAVESTRDLSSQNQLSSEKMEDLREQLISDIARFEYVTDQIERMIQNADNSLKSSQDDYLQSLKTNVSELSTQMTGLLSDYAERANTQTTQHLGIWADSSTQYATTMNAAARALASVVDEIQDKVST